MARVKRVEAKPDVLVQIELACDKAKERMENQKQKEA